MWSSASNLYELANETNAIVESLNADEYAALRSTLEFASSASDLRADRKRLEEVDLKPFSDRVAVLVTVALRADSSKLRYSTKQERREPLRAFLKQRREAEGLSELPLWDQDGALAWARQIVKRRRAGAEPVARVRRHLIDSAPRVQDAELVLRDPRAYPHELVPRAVSRVQRRYRPSALATVSREQDWAFD